MGSSGPSWMSRISSTRTPQNTTPMRRWRGASRDIVTNVGTYPPIIAANIQSIIRDGKNPDAELDKITARNDFDINRLNTLWYDGNADLNPQDHNG